MEDKTIAMIIVGIPLGLALFMTWFFGSRAAREEYDKEVQ